jgi:hypothetical protein
MIDPNMSTPSAPHSPIVFPKTFSVPKSFTIAKDYKVALARCDAQPDDGSAQPDSVALDGEKLKVCGFVALPALTRKTTTVNFATGSNASDSRFGAAEGAAQVRFAALFDGANGPRYGVQYSGNCDAPGEMQHYGVFDGCITGIALRYSSESTFPLSCPQPVKDTEHFDYSFLTANSASGSPYWVMCATAHFTKILPPDNKAVLLAAFDTKLLLATADLTDVHATVGKDTFAVDQIRIVMSELERAVHVRGSYTASALNGTTVYFKDIGFQEMRTAKDAPWQFKPIADLDRGKTFWNNVGKWAADFMVYFSLHGFKLHGN